MGSHPLIYNLGHAIAHLQSFPRHTQSELSESVSYNSVYRNLEFFFRALHSACRMLVENAKYDGRLQVPGDLKRIQVTIHEIYNRLIRIRDLLVVVEKESKRYEQMESPRKLVGPSYAAPVEVKSRPLVFRGRVMVEESLNLLDELERAILRLPTTLAIRTKN